MRTVLTQADLDSVEGLSSRDAARKLGVGKSTINDTRAKARANGGRLLTIEDLPEAPTNPLKILALDLESSPNLAHVWGLWNQNVGLNQLMEAQEVICFGAQWLDSDEVIFRSMHHHGKQAMVEAAHELLSEADVVMGWNTKKYDTRHLNREFAGAKLGPPAPYKNLDLYLDARKVFAFPSNKLDYVAQFFGHDGKVKHEGHTLWVKCMAGDDAAWEDMRTYQEQDVRLLTDLYYDLVPWLGSHPNYQLYAGQTEVCVRCGSKSLVHHEKLTTTAVSGWTLIQCAECRTWQKGRSRSVAATQSVVK